MGVERYINFHDFVIGPGGTYNINIAAKGSAKGHVAIRDERGVGMYGQREVLPEATTVWEDLRAGAELDLPRRCDECPIDAQTFFWRTFTQSALKGFKERKGQGRQLDFPDIQRIDGNDGYVFKTDELDAPGLLWVSRTPDLALSVGLSRYAVLGEQITLLGINCCECDQKAGVDVFNVLPARDETFLEPIDVKSLRYRVGDAGEVVSKITGGQIYNGVVYNVNTSFFEYVKDAFAKEEPSDRRLWNASKIIDSILYEIARQDPRVSLSFDFLPRTWKLFLERMYNNTVGWK